MVRVRSGDTMGRIPYLYNLHNAQSRLDPFALKAVRLAFCTSSTQIRPVAEAVDVWMPGMPPSFDCHK
jgi:hypothetical protein